MTVEEWLGKENKLGIDIWSKKYQHNNESFDEWIDRISGKDEKLKNIILEKKFLFGGRILSNRNIPTDEERTTYSNCFLAGTKVLTEGGYKPIEEIIEGEMVYTHDGSLQKVNKVMSREYEGVLYHIKSKELYNDIYCTPNHQFLTCNGWKKAEELKIRSDGHHKIDRLATINKRLPSLVSYEDLKENRQTADSFSIFVDQNQKLIPYLSKKYSDDRMTLKESNGYIKIEEIETLNNQNTTVYNLSVENNHSYIVEGVVVHNCYVITPPEDNIESIYNTAKKLARTYSYGGGCGIDISKLAPEGAKVHNQAKSTSGAVSFMDTFNGVTEQIGQNGRRGALMISLDCTHPDLEKFITVKTDLNKVTSANISVRISDDFMEAVQEDKDWILYFDRKETGEHIEKIVKAKDIYHLLCKNNWDYAEPGMLFWDRIKNYNLLNTNDEFEYAGTNPCAEEPLPAGGSCLLGSINLSAFVKNGKFDYVDFDETVDIAVKALNVVLDEGLPKHPLAEQRASVKDWRQIGMGVMGIADMLIKMGIRYGSKESIDICNRIGEILACQALETSAFLAEELGNYPKYDKRVLSSEFYKAHNIPAVEKFGLYNSQLLTIAPTGSISTMIGISGGIEPIFANSYTRTTKSLHGHDETYKVYTPIVKEFMDQHNITKEEDLPDYFVTSATIPIEERIAMQSVWQSHIDASISSTINLPTEATIEDVEKLYLEAWRAGLKGVTVYRSGCAREGILVTGTPKVNSKEEKSELKWGEVIKSSDNLIGKKRKLISGCGSLHVSAWFDPKTKKLMETYFNKGSSGGCNNFMIGLSRMVSLACRAGADVYTIKDQLDSTGACPSYATRTATKHDTSKGSCCPMAIGNALVEMYEELLQEDPTFKEVEKVEVKTNQYGTCPECGAPMKIEEGCRSCPECGFSYCS